MHTHTRSVEHASGMFQLSSFTARGVEEVEHDTLVGIEKGILGSPIEKQKEAVVEYLEEMVESVSNQEMTWGEMEISLE